jgi:hypothetical protein
MTGNYDVFFYFGKEKNAGARMKERPVQGQFKVESFGSGFSILQN